MGEPLPLTLEQYAQLEKASRLAQLGEPADIQVVEGRATVHFNLPRQGVSLLVLKWPQHGSTASPTNRARNWPPSRPNFNDTL